MFGRVRKGLTASGALLALGSLGAAARADEAYLCGPDKIVYVAAADLELKKRTDPCIAAYYGIEIKSVAAAPAATPEPAPAAAAAKAAPARLNLKSLSETDAPDRGARTAERQAMLEPPRASPGTDFRNVKVLNAASPDDAVFRHTK